MTRFRIRPGQSAGGNFQMGITIPPAGAFGDTGGDGDGECPPCEECPPDGDCGPPEVFIAGCMSPFLGDGQIILLGIHNLPDDAEVVWTATALSDWNYLISEDGLTSTAHACMVGFFGGDITVTVTVNGEDAGSIVIVDSDFTCPESWPAENPRVIP